MFGNTGEVFLTDPSDCAVFQEVFVQEEYVLLTPHAPRIIVDLGSNVGMTVLFWKLKYPDARVIAVEPDPQTFAKLVRTAKQYPDVSCYQCAISDHDGEAVLYSYPRESFSSALTNRRDGGIETMVPSYTLDSFRSHTGLAAIDVLKYDVEGAEELIFAQPSSLAGIHYCVGEVHEDLMSLDANAFVAKFNAFKVSTKKLTPSRFLLHAIRS
jgi:FkbM family methyltransferase